MRVVRTENLFRISPSQSGFAERPIGIRRECADHLIVLGEAQLRRPLRAYAFYYNDLRTHWSLAKMHRFSRPIQTTGNIRSNPIRADFITTTSGFRFRYRQPIGEPRLRLV